ncbi:MAG: hypothetical protein KIS85_03310 [Anaerolineales bacterium]|nr:hypothetical protein [Anaerolineales bacterium]
MAQYNREIYSSQFARLLNRALKQGGGDAGQALSWLERKYHLPLMLLFTPHRLELSDAYLDVREHILMRMEEGQKKSQQ